MRLSRYQVLSIHSGDEYYSYLLPLPRIEPRFLGHPARSLVQYTKYIVLVHNLKYKRTELSTISIPRANTIRTLTCKLALKSLNGFSFPMSMHFLYHYKSFNAFTTSSVMSYTGCPRRNGQNFGRVFLMLNYNDITQNTYIQS